MKIVKEYIFEKFEEDSDPIKDMGIGMKRIYYYFYVSFPVINKLIDFINPFHVKLLKWLQDYKDAGYNELTPSDIYVVKKLIKKVGLYEIGNTNKVHMPYISKYSGPDISIRRGEFPDYETKGLYGKYSWAQVKNIDPNQTEHYEKIGKRN